MNKNQSKAIKADIVQSAKKKLVEFGVEYFKEKVETTKDDIIKYVEKTIERKIKKEIHKIVYTIISLVIGILGSLFLVYGALDIIVNLLKLPEFLTNIFFGLLLVTVSLIIYIQK